MTDPYAVLGVPRNATKHEVSKAFRSRARLLHPDKQPQGASAADRERAKKAFQELTRANEILSDPDKRAAFDERGATSSGGRGSGSGGTFWRQDQDSGDPAGRGGGGARYFRTQWAPEEPLFDPEVEAEAAAKCEELRRKVAERKRLERYGVSSTWVKPPPVRIPENWAGWKRGSGNDGDAQSDASSELSFDLKDFDLTIGIDLKDLDLDNLVEVDDQDAAYSYAPGPEVWKPTFGVAAQTQNADRAASAGASGRNSATAFSGAAHAPNSSCAGAAAAVGGSVKAAQGAAGNKLLPGVQATGSDKKCCFVQ